ncbi:MAG: carboxylesterase family protein, partial [Novosphingobium sp.]
YARAERFAAPEPLDRWTGLRDALAAGPQCPQMYGASAKRALVNPPGFAEDCLSLNVHVPDGGADVGRKPVYVFIHGGAFVAGSGSAYDGSALARLGDIVVVTFNYRVGVLGFVNFGAALGAEEFPSNLGLRDQIAALAWVRDNIAAFGGDPARVTVGGQSAGSVSLSLLMLAPAAKGLFHGAIMKSGAVSLIHDRERSRAVGRRYGEVLGIGPGDGAALRRMDLRRLFEAQAAVQREMRGGIAAAPWFDGDLVPASLAEAHTHEAACIPLMAGATRDEIRLFELMPGDILPTKWPALTDLLVRQLGREHADRVLAEYPQTKDGRRALATDLTFAMPTRNFAERHARTCPTWFYRFDYSHFIAGATHGLDLTLTWPMAGMRAALARGGRMRGKRAALGERIMAHYAHFVRHGAPGPGWPAYTPDTRATMVFDLDDRIEENPHGARLDAWAGRDVSPGATV